MNLDSIELKTPEKKSNSEDQRDDSKHSSGNKDEQYDTHDNSTDNAEDK